MINNCYWEEGTKQQWFFYASDNSSLDKLHEKVDIDNLLYTSGDEPVNLGIRKLNGKIYSSNFVGLCRLKNTNGKNTLSYDGKEVILKIEPRFDVSVTEMLNAIREDDEFDRYLAPQSTRVGSMQKEVEDFKYNELFFFFDYEDPVYVKDHIALNSSIITASVYLSMLKDLCTKPLMGKMICKEENLVGKVKGRVLFQKNISLNTLKGRDDRVYCKYLRYSEDIIENQVLKAALHKAELFLNKYFQSVSSSKNSFKDMFIYCHNSLSHISKIKIKRHDFLRLKTTGCYAYYRPVINVAKMVLSEISLEASGQTKFTSYIVPYAVSMSKLFEIYVRACLKRSGLNSYMTEHNDIRILQYDLMAKVLGQSGKNYSDYISGSIKPDIIIYNPINEKYIVFDVKYKDITNSRNAREDRLQLLAYSLIYDCDDVGIIFPSINKYDNIYYKPNEIRSAEGRERYFNQIEIAINLISEPVLKSKDGGKDMRIYDYFHRLLK